MIITYFVLVTPPNVVKNEHQPISELFAAGLQTLHVRKPDCSATQLRRYVEGVPAHYHRRLMLHAHHQLIEDYDLKGIHYTESNRPEVIQRVQDGILISTSFHLIQQLQRDLDYGCLDYAFLSSIFDSISKKQYKSLCFKSEEFKATLDMVPFPVLGLGRIDQYKIPKVHELGFRGAAILGAIWSATDPINTFTEIQQECEKYNCALMSGR